ncbi:integrase [Caballeronia sp. SEWSISQ10-4 2]|uniref:integrase n=1 Tax=Caballeronia sp. SEWSISQ10-4 2 TaxID=2937438 RepID=UPI00264CABF8|nr:integrase [Caballeronia sp. SEWSISQ10-4 2]MDN7179381.1 integrase [Caballeronia sp. SEWSISQ10-4 2]
MSATTSFVGADWPDVTLEEVHRFEKAAKITDPETFTAQLNALIREKITQAKQAKPRPESLAEVFAHKAQALRADTRWSPSPTDIQRGRRAQLQAFDEPQNLPLAEFARLAHKSRQQIYKDLASEPKRLLALSVGSRKQRLPDWQLDPVRLQLTQAVLSGAPDIDAWTLFHTLSEPLEVLRDQAPVEVVTRTSVDEVTSAVLNALGIHARGKA